MKKSSKKHIFLAMGLTALTLLTMTGFESLPVSKANFSLLSANTPGFSIIAKNSNNGDLTQIPLTNVSINNSGDFDAYKLHWKDISHFIINLEDAVTGSEENFSYSYTLRWAPELIDSEENNINFESDHSIEIDLLSNVISNPANIPDTVKVYLDEDDLPEIQIDNSVYIGNLMTEDEKTFLQRHGEWGTYQFSFECNSAHKKASAVYQVTPTDLNTLPASFDITSYVKSSTQMLDEARLCEITTEDFKFVDTTKIVWKVRGKSSDGKSYVLMEEDIPSNSNVNALYKTGSHERHGTSFFFDPWFSGTWEVYCEIPATETNPASSSNIIEFSTVKIISRLSIILITCGSIVLGGVLLTVIIIVAKKKEKIW